MAPAKKAAKSGKPAAKKATTSVAKGTAKTSSPKKSASRSMARPDAKPTKKPPQSKPYAEGKWAAEFDRKPGERRNWLMKSEPDVFSFDDLLKAKGRTTHWDGVRNTAARNFLRDGLKNGDRVFYYHSNAEPSAIVGIAEVVREGYPDDSAFDAASDYYDAASDRAHPMWYMVDVRAVEKLRRPVTLGEIKDNAALANMALIRVSRLAVVPVTDAEWEEVLAMSRT
jgi:predicted RNA-binding protein with PUA-like domain